MNNWRGSAKWVIWLTTMALSFAILEAWAIHEHTDTLSRFVWNLSQAFPPIIFIAGFLGGFLCCHFWWMGNPNNNATKDLKS